MSGSSTAVPLCQIKLGTAIALQQLHEYIEGDLTFFCILGGINAEEIPPTWPDRIRISVRALSATTRWWHEYRHDTILLKDVATN